MYGAGLPGELIARIPMATDGRIHYYIEVEDLAGNVNTSDVRTVTVDTTAPVMQNHTVYTEARNALEYVPIHANVSADDLLSVTLVHDVGGGWSRISMVEHVSDAGTVLYSVNCGDGDEMYVLQGDVAERWRAVDPAESDVALTHRTNENAVRYRFAVNASQYLSVEVTYLQDEGDRRIQFLLAGNHVLHGPIELPQRTSVRYRLPVPPEAYADGNLTLSFQEVVGGDAVVSAITVHGYAVEPDTDYMAYIPPARDDTDVRYRIEACDLSMNSVSSPTSSYSTYGANRPPAVSHVVEIPSGDDIVISADITDPDGVAGATLWYSDDIQLWTDVAMSGSGDTYSATMDTSSPDDLVYYYIEVTDDEGVTDRTPTYRTNLPDVALIADDPGALSPVEMAALHLLSGNHLRTDIVDDDDASVSNLSSYGMVVAVNRYDLDSGEIDDLIDVEGIPVILLNRAPESLGFSSRWEHSLWLEGTSNEAFMAPFRGSKFLAVTGAWHYSSAYYYGDYPSGWTPLDTQGGTNAAGYRVNATSGGRGAILPYSPQYLTRKGVEVFDTMIRWVTGRGMGGRAVTPGAAVMVIASDRADVPVLTDREERVAGMLEKRGYTVEYVSMHAAGLYNMSGAGLIVVTEYETNEHLGSWMIQDWVDEGASVLLLSRGGYNIGGSWYYSGSSSSFQHMKVVDTDGFLSAYEGYTFTVTNVTAMDHLYSIPPAGWTASGTQYTTPQYITHLWRENATSGGRAVVYAYDPLWLSDDGRWILNLSLDYLEGTDIGDIAMPAGDVVLLTLSTDFLTPTLTDHERRLSALLLSCGFDVSYLSLREARRGDYSGSTFVVFCEYDAWQFPGATWIESAIDGGVSIGMYAWAGSGMGGSWYSSTDWRMRQYYGYNDTAFGFGLGGLHFEVVSGAYGSPYISSPHPAGWGTVSRNWYNQPSSDYRTGLFLENATSGGRGVILTYDIRDINLLGEQVYGRTFQYLASIGQEEITVDPGTVALVVNSPLRARIPRMDTREAAVDALLRDLGYNVSYLCRLDLRNANLRHADAVVVPYHIDGLTGDAAFWSALIDSGVDVVLMYDSVRLYGGNIGQNSDWRFRQMYVMSDTEYLERFGHYVLTMQNEGSSLYRTPAPTNWIGIGRNTYNTNYHTMFVSGSASGGRGAIVCYDPLYLTPEGREILDQVMAWATHRPTGPIGVPDGDALLLTLSTDATLTETERAVRDLLEANGYTVTPRPQFMTRRIDWSNASLVVLAEFQDDHYYDHGLEWAEEVVDSGTPLLLLKDSAKAIFGASNWQHSGDWRFLRLYTETATAFLEDYQYYNFAVQTGEAYSLTSTQVPARWTYIGRNPYSTNYKTAVILDNTTSGGRGAVLTYDPARFIEAGRLLLNRTLDWLEHEETERIAIDADVVIAILSEDYRTPTLTAEESNLSARLQTLGYSVAYISYREIRRGDYSNVRALMAVSYHESNYFPVGRTFIDSLIDSGVSVGLFHRSAQILQWSDWDVSPDWRYLRLVTTNATAFLAEYADFNLAMQTGGSAYRVTSPSWNGWSVIGRNHYSTSYITALVREPADRPGRGAVLTYDITMLGIAGEEVMDRTLAYLMNEPLSSIRFTSGAVVMLIESTDDATPTLNDRENATRQYLEDLGHDVEYLSILRARHADYLNASLVVVCHYDDLGYMALGSAFIDGLVDSGTPVLLLHAAGRHYVGTWASSTAWQYRQLYVEDNGTCLAGYPNGSTHTPQSSGYAYRVTDPSFAGWSAAGRNTYSTSYKTVLTRENGTTGGRGVMYTYDPYYYTGTGRDIFNDTVSWAMNGTKPTIDLNLTLLVVGITGHRVDTYLNATVRNDGDSPIRPTYFHIAFYDGPDIIGVQRLAVPDAGDAVTATMIWRGVVG
ncbi:MAG TPA: hypothetical protein EYP43_03160, partial [Thermoplasmata archaeon]|nr:hypothetical protein [Thermoplasmata archaeon]